MKTKDLKINFRYLGGNIACLSVDSIVGKSIHNDINNEEAIIIFNSLVGEKENCQTVKKLLQENQELKEKLDKYENPKDMTLFAMWCTEKVKDENEKLKEEITNLSKDVDMWNAKYNDMFDENRMLKKQAEEKENIACNWKDSCLENAGKIEISENQQKEFIKYLENEIKRLKENDIYEPLQRMALATHQHNLSKYKEIIGVSDENNIK